MISKSERRLAVINRGRLLQLVVLALLPNLLAVFNIDLAAGWKIHLFQFAIFIAARYYGVTGGLVSGFFGSFYSAISLANPYIIGGNIILAVVSALLLRRGWSLLAAVLAAFFVQLLWLVPTDVYLMAMPVAAVNKIVASLLITNIAAALIIILAEKLWQHHNSSS